MLKIQGSQKEFKESRASDSESRDVAPRILSPDAVQGKNWRATKVLQTTLGGSTRPITKQDLAAFKRNITTLTNRVEFGITAREVISLSMEADKKRSRKQINTAVPVRMKGGDIQFITNAGPDSKRNRHNVQVVLRQYEAGLASGTPLQAAKKIANADIKFDCSCEHHRYVFRYVTTLMKANAGRAETGFPKMKNPKLEGVACKHVLRVMIELSTSMFIHKKIAKMIEADRSINADKTRKSRQKTISLTQKEANEITARQNKNKRAIAKALAKIPKPKRQDRPRSQKISTESQIQALKEFGLSDEQIESIINA